MDVQYGAAETAGTKGELRSSLKCLLADEYMLLNKVSYYLLDTTSPFTPDSFTFLQKAYQDLKENTEVVAELLRRTTYKGSLSINDIIANTQLKKADVFHSKVAAVETLLDDHLKIINHISDTTSKFYKDLGEDEVLSLKQLEEKHEMACERLRNYLKNIFSYDVI